MVNSKGYKIHETESPYIRVLTKVEKTKMHMPHKNIPHVKLLSKIHSTKITTYGKN